MRKDRRLTAATTCSWRSDFFGAAPAGPARFSVPAEISGIERSLHARVGETVEILALIVFKSVPQDYDPTDRRKAVAYLQQQQSKGEIVTGLLFVDETVSDLHELNRTSEVPLTKTPYEKLCPGSAELESLQEEFR